MKKSFKGKHKQYSSGKHSDSIDLDPLSTSIIDQLLNSQVQWRNENQIIKLTFRAMADLMQAHSQTINDLKSIITTRASKQQVSTGLALKANASDLSKIIEQISTSLDSKVTYGDINSILKEYAHKKDINQLLVQQKQSINRGNRSRRNQQQNQMETRILKARIDDFQKQITKRLGGCVTLSQFQELVNIVEQKVNISEMNQVLETRVSKQYLSTCLQKKASKSDVEAMLTRKAECSDLQYIVNSLQMKASLPTIQKLTQIIQNKADRSDLLLLTNQRKMQAQQNSQKISSIKNHIDNKISQFRRQIELSKSILNQNLKTATKQHQNMLRSYTTSNQLNLLTNQIKKENIEQFIGIKQKIQHLERQSSNQFNYESFKRQLTNQINLRKRCQQKIYQQIDDTRRRVQQISKQTVQKIQFFNFKSQVTEQLDQKIQTQYVQEAFNKWEVDLSQKMELDKQQIYTLIQRIQKTLSDSISANSADILNLTNTFSSQAQSHARTSKYDQFGFEDIIRKNRRQIQQCRKTVDQVYGQLKGKIDISEYETDLLEIRKKFDAFDRQVSVKANIKDVCVLADSKPNIQDVNKALKEIKSVVDGKTSQQDLQDVVKDQSIINQTLLCQNIIGRWLWQSGHVKPGGLVPWQSQFANTMPDYYFWQKDKTSILILVGGFYQITACTFGRGTPNLQINGQNLYSKNDENTNNQNINVREHKKISRKKKDRQLLGSTVEQYISLPARSRISVTVAYEGSEGFLNIRRL